jgi:hypothetical protein
VGGGGGGGGWGGGGGGAGGVGGAPPPLDSIKGQIQAFSLLVTGFSTFSLVLQNAGLGYLVPYLGGALALVVPVYAYYYFEGGVWNQVSRDRNDKSSNFSSPSQFIGNILAAVGVAAALKGDRLSDDERAALEAEMRDVFEEYRDGVDIDD